MSEPTQQAAPPARARLRPGMPVTFVHPDPVAAGEVISGHALVLKVSEDGSTAVLAPLSLLHLSVAADNVQPVKLDEVPTTAPQPAPEAGS